MWVRAAALAASIFIAGNVLAAECIDSAAYGYGETQAGKTVRFDPYATITRGKPAAQAQAVLPPLSFRQFGDDEGASGPDPHARELANIAVFDSVGNRDAVEIASARLRQFGVTSEEIQDAVAWTKLHGGDTISPSHSQGSSEVNANSVWVVSY